MRNVTIIFDDQTKIGWGYSSSQHPSENYTFHQGDKVSVAPVNKNKKKNRGRSGIIFGYYKDREGRPSSIAFLNES